MRLQYLRSLINNGQIKSLELEEQQKAYTEVGGTPFLDNQYTVFGEVEEGLDVVEKIQNCETMRGDRPKEDISMEISIIEE